MIKQLHHDAYRCRDSEETRAFYEDFLGLPLVCSLDLDTTKTGRAVRALHTFYQLDNGAHLAFFETPDVPYAFEDRHDFDLHIALEVDYEHLQPMLEKGKRTGIESRGITDHDFMHSIYFRDPNGYVIELTAKMPHHDEAMDPTKNNARGILDRWQRSKTRAAS